MPSLVQNLVEQFIRSLEVRNVLDVGCVDSEYIPFLFQRVGVVDGVDFRFIDNTHKYYGFFQTIYPLNFRYFCRPRIVYDAIVCTNYLAKCGVIYNCGPDTPHQEQVQLVQNMLGMARKGIFVTVPFTSTPAERRIEEGQYYWDRYRLQNLLDSIENPRYTVEVKYYHNTTLISPQDADKLVYPEYATCAVGVTKGRL